MNNKIKNIEKVRVLEVNEIAKKSEIVLQHSENHKRIAFNLDCDYYIKKMYDYLIPQIESVADIEKVLKTVHEELGIILGSHLANGLKALVTVLNENTKNLNETLTKLVAIRDNIEDLITVFVYNDVLFEIYDLLEEKGLLNETF